MLNLARGQLQEMSEFIASHKVSLVAAWLCVMLLLFPLISKNIIIGDDWLFLFNPRSRNEWFYGIGRVGHDYVRAILADRLSPAYSSAIFLSSLCLVMSMLCYICGVSSSFILSLCIVLFVLSPIHAENLYFKDNHVPLSVSILLSTLALLSIFRLRLGRSAAAVVAGILLLIGMLIHQAAALFSFTAFLGILLIQRMNLSLNNRWFIERAATYALSVVFAVLCYFPIVKLHQGMVNRWPIPKQYLLLESLNTSFKSLWASFLDTLSYILQFYFFSQHLLSGAGKIVPLILIAFICIGVAIGKRRRAISIYAMLALFLVSPFSIGIIRSSEINFRYSALTQLTLVLPFLLMAIDRLWHQKNSAIVRLSGALAIALSISYYYSQSNISYAAEFTQQRDISITERILVSIDRAVQDSDLDIGQPHSIIFDADRAQSLYDNGIPFNGLIDRAPMYTSQIVCGVYSCNTTKLPEIFRLLDLSYSGKRRYFASIRDWRSASTGVNGNEAELRSTGLARWPEKGSVRVVGQNVFVGIGDVVP